MIGASEAFRMHTLEDGRSVVRIDADNTLGIHKRPVNYPLDASTRFAWDWCYHELPIAVAENTIQTHDYCSIALEFDNGRDLTFFFSCDEKLLNKPYQCPHREWNGKNAVHFQETHVALRAGIQNLGKWFQEDINVLEEYERCGCDHTGTGPPPKAVTGVWLIGLTICTHGRARADLANCSISGKSVETLTFF